LVEIEIYEYVCGIIENDNIKGKEEEEKKKKKKRSYELF